MGPVFQRTTTTAGALTFQPLQTAPAWQHRFLAVDSIIEFSILADVVDSTYEVTLGSNTEVQSSNISGGGTIGVYPNFNEVSKTIVGEAGDELAFTIVVTGTDTVMLEIHLTPA